MLTPIRQIETSVVLVDKKWRILTLEYRDRLYSVSATNIRCTSLRHSEVFDLPFLNEVFHGTRYVLNRHTRVNDVKACL